MQYLEEHVPQVHITLQFHCSTSVLILPAESMTTPALHVETKTNPTSPPLRVVLCLSSICLVFLYTYSTLAVWVRTPLHGRVSVDKVAEIEAGVFLEEMLWHKVTYGLLYMATQVKMKNFMHLQLFHS